MAFFLSDNGAPASPEILSALTLANQGPMQSYGDDPITQRVREQLCDLFETELQAFPVATGTAANALALSCICPPFGAILCHKEAHIRMDECLAPEFYTHGARIHGIAGYGGKLAAPDLRSALTHFPTNSYHSAQACAVSITQATEAGTAYSEQEVKEISEVCQETQLFLHMDGARFANAVASQGTSPADLTWRSGVNCLTFGATKNGALAAEMVIFFPNIAEIHSKFTLSQEFQLRRKRAGHLLSKSRYISAQWEAYLQNGLWLGNAAYANQCAKKIEQSLSTMTDMRIIWPVQANEIFVSMTNSLIQKLQNLGHQFHIWSPDSERSNAQIIRLVTSFATQEAEINAFLADIKT